MENKENQEAKIKTTSEEKLKPDVVFSNEEEESDSVILTA